MNWGTERRRVVRIVHGGVVAVVVLAVLAGVSLAVTRAENTPEVELPFFAYLTSCEVEPLLIAFNPSRFDPRRPYPINAASMADIRADLSALRAAFNGLVLYEFQHELTSSTLTIAHELGYKAVVLGIGNPKAAEEIEAVAETVRQFYPKLALAVVIGNEGLINNRYTIIDVQQAAERLRALLPPEAAIPFSTSEPIGEYGLEELRSFGDFLAPNIHPAIDQEGADPAAGAVWVRKRAQTLATVARRPVFVKETGIPNGGSPAYTPETQRLFWEAYAREGALVTIDVPVRTWISFAAAFEAFDMQWKAEKTGMPIEGHWGFLNVNREPYPAFEAWRQAFRSANEAKARSSG